MSKTIFEDHKKEGKKLIPPLMTLGNFVNIGWIDYIVPDVIWIALLIDRFGDKNGMEVVNKFVAISTKYESDKFRNYAFISSFENLPLKNKSDIYNALESDGVLNFIVHGLSNFLNLYPSCPFNFLRPNYKCDELVDQTFLIRYKELLRQLNDKGSRLSTMTIANVVYSMMILDRMKIVKDSPIAQLPKIQDYPNTEISRIIASSLRATINTLYNPEMFDIDNSEWAKDFWNRSFEIEPCKI